MLGVYNGVFLQPMFPNRPTYRARIGSPFTHADLLHDFSGPTNRHDKSQRVNRPLTYRVCYLIFQSVNSIPTTLCCSTKYLLPLLLRLLGGSEPQ